MNETSTHRIALVTTELRLGGAERNLVALALGLARREFAPHVYSLAPRPDAGEDSLVDELESAAIPVSFVNVRRNWQFSTAVGRLREMLQRQSPELIQSFLFHANVVSAFAGRGLNVPIVAGLRVGQRQWFRQFVQRRLADRFAAFVCVSQSVAASAGRLPSEKVHVIHNGIESGRFENIVPANLTAFGVDAQQRVVLGMGRMDRQKGFDLLIDAARTFLLERQNAVLLLVGQGPDLSALRKRAAKVSLPARIVFAPWQLNALPILAAADVVAAPSRYEGMSNVLLEAAALGRPVVATDVEGVRESLSPIGHSMIVPQHDAAALAERIGRLLDNRTEAHAIADANRRHVHAQFPADRTMSLYAELYISLISPTLPK